MTVNISGKSINTENIRSISQLLVNDYGASLIIYEYGGKIINVSHPSVIQLENIRKSLETSVYNMCREEMINGEEIR